MSEKLERLWAPWRLEHLKKRAYSQSSKEEGCVFCHIFQEKASEENFKLYQGNDFFIVMNRYPYNPHHLLIIPNQHCGDLSALATQTWLNISKAAKISLEILKQHTQSHGFNIGLNMGKAGGASIVEHLHLHVLPRWAGDTNFLPLIAETKSLPVHNITVFKQLKPLFADFSDRMKRDC